MDCGDPQQLRAGLRQLIQLLRRQGVALEEGLDLTARDAPDVLEVGEVKVEVINERRRFEALMEALPVGVALMDAEGGALRVNRAYEQLWGGPCPRPQATDDYVSYRAWWLETGQPLQPEEWASAQAVRQGETVIGQMLEIERFDGSRTFVHNSAAPIRDAAGVIAGSAVAIMDISSLKQAEESLREDDRRKDEFLAMLSHELRNALTPIVTAMQILKQPGLNDTRFTWCRDLLDRQIGHLGRLVDELLDISRITRGRIELHLEPCDVADIVQRGVEMSRSLIDSRQHEFSLHLPPEAALGRGRYGPVGSGGVESAHERGKIYRAGWADLVERGVRPSRCDPASP